MKLKVIVIQLCNPQGFPESYDVIKEWNETICVHATDAKGVRHQFDSEEATYLSTWAEERGLIVKEETHDLRELLSVLDKYADKLNWHSVMDTGSKFLMPEDIEETKSGLIADRYAGKKAREYFVNYPSPFIIGE